MSGQRIWFYEGHELILLLNILFCRFYLRGGVIFLLIFSITWIFGYAFINRSNHSTLYGYLFAVFNLLMGVFVLLFVCVQHDKVDID